MTLELPITEFAGEALDTLVLILVHFESRSRLECFVAIVTFEWAIVAVNIDV